MVKKYYCVVEDQTNAEERNECDRKNRRAMINKNIKT